MDRFLVISDLQIPFEAERALPFCLYLKRHYNIPLENVLCVGDEVDEYFGGQWEKDPDARHTPNSEIKETKDRLKSWFKAFPEMKIATSNHGMRWAKKASAAQLPSQMIRSYQEILETPETWRWQDRWVIEGARSKFLLTHGMEYGGMYAYRQAPLVEGMSVVFGHLHANAGIAHVRTNGLRVWGFCTGALIEPEDYAFQYGKWNRFKPTLGAGVIIDGGRTPIWHPYD